MDVLMRARRAGDSVGSRASLAVALAGLALGSCSNLTSREQGTWVGLATVEVCSGSGGGPQYQRSFPLVVSIASDSPSGDGVATLTLGTAVCRLPVRRVSDELSSAPFQYYAALAWYQPSGSGYYACDEAFATALGAPLTSREGWIRVSPDGSRLQLAVGDATDQGDNGDFQRCGSGSGAFISFLGGAGTSGVTPTPVDPASADRCVPAPSGMVSWWRGEGNARDAAGSNDGTLQGGATFAPGFVGQGFSFDGTGGVFASSNGMPTGGADRTVEFWVNVRRFSSFETFFAGYGDFSTPGGSYELIHSGYVLFSQWGDEIVGPGLNTGGWYHLAVVTRAGVTTIYANGAAWVSGTLHIDTPAGTSFALGAATRTETSRVLDGTLDEVTVYNRALDPYEIATIAAANARGKCPP